MKRINTFVLLFFMLSLSTFAQSKQAKTFVLVHAQWHDKSCWNKLVPLMNQNGNKVITLDLPAHGDDTTSADSVTLDDCVKKVSYAANAVVNPVILVGHSSSGIVIAQAAEEMGKAKVAGLVFLDAFLPGDGESVFSLADKYAPETTPLSKALVVSNDHKTVGLDTAKVESLLYHDCTRADIEYAKSRLCIGPIATLATPARLTSKYLSIPKFYILCTQARDMDKSELAKNVPTKKIFKLESSHSPFISMPDKLAEILTTVAAQCE